MYKLLVTINPTIYYIILYHIISYHIISYIISYHISYHIILYYIILYCVILYYIILYTLLITETQRGCLTCKLKVPVDDTHIHKYEGLKRKLQVQCQHLF